MTMHWEYRTVRIPASGGFLGGKFNDTQLTTTLNDLGAQRWELVSTFVTHQGYGQSREIVAILKREK
jgi:hypothetical protein